MTSRGRRMMSFSVPALALMGVVLSSVGLTGQDPERHAIQLQPDASYYESSEAFIPGRIVGAPSAATLPADDPRALPPGRVSVLVHMDPGHAAGQRASIRALAAQKGGDSREFKAVLPDVLNLRDIPESDIQTLENMPGVIKVEIDQYHPNLVRLHDATSLINGLQSQVAAAGHSADGSGVRVCVCDTGIDSDHTMYSSRIDASAGFDFYNNDNNPEDDNGHGSHVAGIAVGGTGLSVDFGCGAGSQDFQGVAPGATLIGAKILNQFGGGFDSDIIAGIDHCADQTASGGRADVINLSIGTGQFSGNCTHSWAVAANNAVANGVVVVAASGNENYANALSSPACGVDVIAVGATWKADYPTCEDSTTNWNWGVCTDFGPQTDDVGCFSNESDNLDVSAPGLNIWSASNAAGGSSITGQSGTSMASPAVVGLAALLLEADPSLTPAQVRQHIRDGAIDLGPAGFDRGYGYGRIDVINSLNLVQPAVCPDGSCNGNEDQCNCPQDCGSPPSTETNCSDGVDENCDGDTDCADADCASDPACICNNDGTCDAGEDCNNCSNDCISGSGGACNNGVCEPGEDCLSCPQDCNGKQNGNPNGRFCCSGTSGGGGGENPVDCGDTRCTQSSWNCSVSGGTSYCCGDGWCTGAEDDVNCAIDCGCSGPADCDDGVACTDDDCVGGACTYTPDNANCADDGLFCNGTEFCDAAADCSSTGDPCPSSGTTCNESTNTCDQQSCNGGGVACNVNSDCCSNKCKNGTCRGG